MSHLPLDRNPNVFKVLGVKLSTNTEQIPELNFSGKLFDIEQIIHRWMKRILTPLGKIVIIKSLHVSKLNYLCMLLPNPPGDFFKQLYKILFKFLWNEKPDKINRITICKSVKEGGLGMIDIVKFVQSLKLIWIRKLADVSLDNNWKTLFFSSQENCHLFLQMGTDFYRIKEKMLKNSFWKDCLEAFCKFSSRISILNYDEFVTEPVFYNPKIIVDKISFFYSHWFDKGVSHFLNERGDYISLDEFHARFGIETSFLQYYGVIQAI